MTTGILVVHTPAQAELTSTLCDMLELSLSLPDGAVVCSSLPGYSLGSAAASVEEWNAAVDASGAVVALIDDAALSSPQFLFELASAVCFGKWIVLLLEREELRDALPWQLAQASTTLRSDRAAIVAMIEDLAFKLDVSPRVGADVQSAIDLLVQDGLQEGEPYDAQDGAEPLRESGERDRAITVRPPARAERVSAPLPPPLYESLDATEESLREDELIALDDEDLRELGPDDLSCGLSLEAGRAISECSFHRAAGGDLTAELDEPFGRFVDAVGGNWNELKRIPDVDVWLGATDNLLESLPPDTRHVSDWFELGFQFSTLMSIAEQGLPPDPEQRAAVEEIWTQSMTQFQRSAESARLRHHDVHRVQALLESMIRHDGQRDYTNIPRSLETLRKSAAAADGI